MTYPSPITADPVDHSKEAAATLGLFRASMDLLEELVDQMRAAWNAFNDSMQAVIRRLQHELNSDSIWSTIVEWIADDIKDVIKLIEDVRAKIQEGVDKILARMSETLRARMPVGSLLDTAVRYNQHIIGPFSNLGADMEAKGDIVYWVGPTKDAYTQRVVEQTKAVAATTQKLIATSSWLAEVGEANLAYMTSVGDKAAEVIAELTTACIDAGMTISGLLTQAPLTLQQLSEVVGTAVGELIKYGLDLANYLGSTVTRVNTLANELHNHSDLDTGSAWPSIGE